MIGTADCALVEDGYERSCLARADETGFDAPRLGHTSFALEVGPAFRCQGDFEPTDGVETGLAVEVEIAVEPNRVLGEFRHHSGEVGLKHSSRRV